MRVLIVPLIISLGLAAGQTITPAERQAILAYQLNMPRRRTLRSKFPFQRHALRSL